MDGRETDSNESAVTRVETNKLSLKCLRLESSEHNDEPQVMNISDLPVELIDAILEHLNVKNLINVAQSTKKLQAVARSVFRRKYGTKPVNFIARFPRSTMFHQRGDLPEIIETPKLIVRRLKTCLQLLRCLGPSIDTLAIIHPLTGSLKYVNQYINKYCTNLISISYGSSVSEHILVDLYRNSKILAIFRKPFNNVQEIKIYVLHIHLPKFNYWFPNLRHLELCGIDVDRTTIKEVSLPNLEHLSIRIDEESQTRDFSLQCAVEFLRVCCPKLVYLSLDSRSVSTRSEFIIIIDKNPEVTDFSNNSIRLEIDSSTNLMEVPLFGWKYSQDFVHFQIVALFLWECSIFRMKFPPF